MLASPLIWRLQAAATILALLLAGCRADIYEVEHTDYHPPAAAADDGLADDKLEDKQTAFDPELIDRRPLGDWRINSSEAVIKLDVPLAKPDEDADLLVLRPSYADALKAAKERRPHESVLPSVNLLDGKAKQFDDGLYAAIDQAWFQGVEAKLQSLVALVERLLEKVGARSPAAPYLAAALTLGGKETPAGDKAASDALIQNFNANPALAKPIGFYTWNATLQKCWAFMRFLQQPQKESDPAVAALVQALDGDPSLRSDYEQATQFYGKLTNPLARLSLADLVGVDLKSAANLKELRAAKGITEEGVAFFPPSTSREAELYQRLFPFGVPAGANLMKELVCRIRSGQIDLTPRANSGWYDHQVFALETLLLAERGEEHNKLLLTKPYKKRMLEAFEALITKRRETHVRQALPTAATPAPPQELESVQPRLRVEPCPTFYVRTARSYAFLHEFLTASLGEETLRLLHGLKQGGQRETDLKMELAGVRDLFYGLYLVSCEDIGHKPILKEGEVADPEACYAAAAGWLESAAKDADLAADTRVAVPVYYDPQRHTMRLWVTLGVRLTRLDAQYVRPPRIKPASGEGEWATVEGWKLHEAHHLIAVDEFAEVEIPSVNPPNRDELRALCDKHKTKAAIVAALAESK